MRGSGKKSVLRNLQPFGAVIRFMCVNKARTFLITGLLVLAGCIGPGTPVNAQAVSSPVFMTDFEAAKTFAKEQEVPLLLIFSGSDWCRGCIELDQEVLQTQEFIQYAEEQLVVVKADFPRKRKNQLNESLQEQNDQLATRYNSKGEFPKMILFDKTGKVLGQPQPPKSGGTKSLIMEIEDLEWGHDVWE